MRIMRLSRSARRHLPLVAFSAAAAFALVACGDDDAGSSEPAPLLGKLTLSGSNANDNGSFDLHSADACARNADTGRVDVTLSQRGSGSASLTLAIKDFSSTAKTYTCRQAADNSADAGNVGGKFESCMVDVKVPASAGATTLNGYSMYRETTTVKPFGYLGTCSVNVTAATPTITGTVSCTDLVQTTLEGGVRNPIDAGVNADVTAEFRCTF